MNADMNGNGKIRSGKITPENILKTRAYFEQGTNSIVLDVNPASSAKAVRSVILDGAKIYSEPTNQYKKLLKESEHRLKILETNGSFRDYVHARKGYEELKDKLADAEEGKLVDPNVIVRGFGFEAESKYSKADFRELLEEVKTDARNEQRKRYEEYRNSGDPYVGRIGIYNPLSAHYDKKFEKAHKTCEALDYMSKKLEFHSVWPAPPTKNTASYRKA